jgi:hypothetical protein
VATSKESAHGLCLLTMLGLFVVIDPVAAGDHAHKENEEEHQVGQQEAMITHPGAHWDILP